MTRVAGLWVVALLSACERSSGTVPPPKAASNSAIAGDCAAILQNVRAGRDVIVNVRCDLPTEVKMTEVLAQGNWKTHCPYVYPAHGWQVKADGTSVDYKIVPSPGNYWSQYGFVVGISRSELSQVDYGYVNSLAWDDVNKQFPVIDRKSFARIQEIAKMYPPEPAAISQEADELLMSDDATPLATLAAAIRQRVVGYVAIRREIQYEDGANLGTLNLAILREDGGLNVGVTLLHAVDAYPSWSVNSGDSPPLGTVISCTANKNVDSKTFKNLSTIFIERHSLAPKVMSGEACAPEPKAT